MVDRKNAMSEVIIRHFQVMNQLWIGIWQAIELALTECWFDLDILLDLSVRPQSLIAFHKIQSILGSPPAFRALIII